MAGSDLLGCWSFKCERHSDETSARWGHDVTSAGYLQAAEADHAVHHLGDTETVPEVVEGVVLVVVMDTKLETERRCERSYQGREVTCCLQRPPQVSPAIS